MSERAASALEPEQRREVAAWIEANREGLPDPVRKFLDLHRRYLAAGEGDPLRRAFEAALRELRRALRVTPSSEKRRSSGSPLAGLPGEDRLDTKSERERLEARAARGRQLADWHRGLKRRHDEHVERVEKRLAKMPKEKLDTVRASEDLPPLQEIELTEEQRAQDKAAGDRFVEHLMEGGGADPAMRSVAETLMPGNTVLGEEEHASVPAVVPEVLAGPR